MTMEENIVLVLRFGETFFRC